MRIQLFRLLGPLAHLLRLFFGFHMARLSLRVHPKFRRLIAILQMPEAHVLGHLQMLWETAYEVGEEIGDGRDVEMASGWVGAPGILAAALEDCGGSTRAGFVEMVDGRYRIHDLYDHAPEYVKKRLDRVEVQKQRGLTLHEMRVSAGVSSANKRKETGASGEQTAANGSKRQQTALLPTLPYPTQPIPKDERYCAEPKKPGSPPSPPPRALVQVECVGQGPKTWPLTEEWMAVWKDAYPGLDVPAIVKQAIVWIRANPTKRKTYKGMPAFFSKWLSAEQNRGPRPGSQANGKPPREIREPRPHDPNAGIDFALDDEYPPDEPESAVPSAHSPLAGPSGQATLSDGKKALSGAGQS